MYVRIRTGTDVALFGGLMNYVLQNNKFHDEYVRNYTNATFIVNEKYGFSDGLFNGYDPKKRSYGATAWNYELGADGFAHRDMSMQHPRCVFQLMKAHYARYTPAMVETITGIPQADFLKIAEIVGEMGRPDKVMTIVYAVGWTQHTTGVQIIRGGRVAAASARQYGTSGRRNERRARPRQYSRQHGSRDLVGDLCRAISKCRCPDKRASTTTSRRVRRRNSIRIPGTIFGTNYKKFLVSLLKAWYGDNATKDNDFAFSYLPKPDGNSSWMTIWDQAIQGKMEGVFLSGMTATSIGPGYEPSLARAFESQVARRHGRVPNDDLGVLAHGRRYGSGQDSNRSLHAADDALDREIRQLHQ